MSSKKKEKKSRPAAKAAAPKRDLTKMSSQNPISAGKRMSVSMPLQSGVMTGINAQRVGKYGTVKHPTLGYDGVRISGTQPMITNNLYIFNNYGLSSLSGYGNVLDGAHIYMQPLWLGGPLAFRAITYEHYVFRKIRIVYTSTISPSNAALTQSMAACIASDPNPDTNIPNSYTAIRCTTPSVAVATWVPSWSLEYKYSGPKVWYVSDTASDSVAANIRDEDQAVFCCLYNGVQETPTMYNIGYFDIEYEIELYNSTAVQTPSLAFSKSLTRGLKDPEAKKQIADKAKELSDYADSLRENKQQVTAAVTGEQPSLGPAALSIPAVKTPGMFGPPSKK